MKKRYSSKVILLFFSLMLLMILNCCAEEYADQEAFLADMAAGIDKRLGEADKDIASMSKEENMEYYHTLVSYELEYVEKYSDQVFADEKFNMLAHFYIEACQMQRYATENYRNENLYNGLWNGGSNCRSGIITTMYERYDLPITAAQASNYVLVPTFSFSMDDDNGSDTTSQTSKPTTSPETPQEEHKGRILSKGDLSIVNAKVRADEGTLGTQYEHYEYSFTVINNSNYPIESMAIICNITDEKGNALGSLKSHTVNKTIPKGSTATIKGKVYESNYDIPCLITASEYIYDCEGDGNTNSIYVEENNAREFTLNIVKEYPTTTATMTPKPTQSPVPGIDIDKIVQEIKGYKNGETDKAWNMIKMYHDKMTESQLESCLKSYGRWAGLEYAENRIKEDLKSPRSYYRYEGSASNPVKQEDGTYKTEYELKYGATNSFGAEVTDTDTVYVYFKIDIENVRVTFVNTRFAPYDAWEHAKS